MSRLSAAIMAHPLRRDRVGKIIDALDIGDRKFGVSWDDYGEGLWANARRAWTMYDPDATHHVVLQDDVLPCRDLFAGLEKALDALSEQPECVSLFCGRKETANAVEANRSWVWAGVAKSAQGLVLPTRSIEECLDWIDVNADPLAYEDDFKISMWMLSEGRKMYYTAPSLVEHTGNAESIIGDVAMAQIYGVRKASCFIGADRSALEIDWQSKSRARKAGFDDPTYYRKFYVGPGTWDEVLMAGLEKRS